MKRTVMSSANNFKLCELVRNEYTVSNLNDVEFAAKAKEALGVEVTCHNVQTAREVFGIPSKRAVIVAKKKSQPMTRLAKIEARLNVLEEFMRGFS